MLSFYNKTLKNVVAFTGDNCSTNKTAGIPLIGCISHKFNLAVNNYLREFGYEESLLIVDKIMVKLHNPKLAGRLRGLTDRVAVKRNVTRSTSVFEMVQRYKKLAPLIQGFPDLQENLPCRRTENKLDTLLTTFKAFTSGTIHLQQRGLNVEKARGVIDEFLEAMVRYLAPEAAISLNPVFESAVVKLLRAEYGEMSATEIEEVHRAHNRATSKENARDLCRGARASCE